MRTRAGIGAHWVRIFVILAGCWLAAVGLAQPLIRFPVQRPVQLPAMTPPADPAYWRLPEIRRQFETWQREFPDIVHLAVIGASGCGESIDAVCISDAAGIDEGEPSLVFHAAQHANECNGTTAIMRQIAELLTGYGRDAKVTARVDGLELWFVPVLNPDGHAVAFDDTAFGRYWRKTLHDNDGNGHVDFPGDGVDLNRNWDWHWDESRADDPTSQKYKGWEPFCEPETAALRDFILKQRPVVIVDYHSPVTMAFRNYIFFPWLVMPGREPGPDWAVAERIAGQWAAATLTETGEIFRHAYAHDTLPKQQNWSYGRLGIMSFLMEISQQCWWSGAMVDSIGARVARGSTTLVDRALHGPGLRGDVTDAVTGEPLIAEVRVLEMYAETVGPHLTEAVRGRYFRLTKEGDLTVRVSCAGYATQTVSVCVPDSGWVVGDFALQIEHGWQTAGHRGSQPVEP